MCDFLCFWSLKTRVRPGVSVNHCYSPCYCSKESWKKREKTEKRNRGCSIVTIKERGSTTQGKDSERRLYSKWREEGHPQLVTKQNSTDTNISTASIPWLSAFFYHLKLFLQSLSLPLFHPAFMSVLFISFLVEVSASPCLPTTKAARNNLLILSTLLCRLWFCVSLLMGLISKTQSNIPARSN